jgi:hypothetical protein
LKPATTHAFTKKSREYGRAQFPKPETLKSEVENEESPIRQRLRRWLAENKQQYASAPEDSASNTRIKNTLSRSQSTAFTGLDRLDPENESVAEGFDSYGFTDEVAELSTVGTPKSNPGDLIEIR